VLLHLKEALGKVRKQEYARLARKDRRFIKGQKYTLLSHWQNLSLEGNQALELLFHANQRLSKDYERLIETSETMIKISAIALLFKRLQPLATL
jgi:hypothetical protein